MDMNETKSKLQEALNKAKASAQGVAASGKAKLDAAGGVAGLKAQAVAALGEVKANFKADEGATGARKVQSMFVNLWKSGTAGKAALGTGAAAAVLLSTVVLASVCGGSGAGTSSDAAKGGTSAGETASDKKGDSAKEVASTQKDTAAKQAAVEVKNLPPPPSDTLVLKGLWMRMPGDAAVQACQKIVGSAKDIAVVDWRNGIEREKDEARKAAEAEAYAKNLKKGEEDVDRFLKWCNRKDETYDTKKFCAIPLEKREVLKYAYANGTRGVIEGSSTTLTAQALASLAANFGYQIQWMLPGKREVAASKKNNPPKSTEKMELITGLVPMEKITKEDLAANWGGWNFLSVGILHKYSQRCGDRRELFSKKGLVDPDSRLEPFIRLVPRTTNGVAVAKEEIVKNWLVGRGYPPPSDKVTLPAKNLIQISRRYDQADETQWPELCNVWIDDQGAVYSVYFNEQGMDRLFNAEDLTGREFAQALVKNYPGIPDLTPAVKVMGRSGTLITRATTWTHKNPKGYQVDLFEQAVFDENGNIMRSKDYPKDSEAGKIISMAEKRWLKFSAVKPESARTFD